MRAAWLIGVALAVGCTKDNPRSCTDGTCTDPSLPFCDVDGALSGTPGTCISVDCTPNQFEQCLGTVALVCNAQGTDYTMLQCPNGCGDNGCVSCSTSAQCANPNPVCTAEHTCRGCEQDSECASTVCDVPVGTCLPESQVVFASPTGSASGSCSLQAPCTIARAIAVATAATTTPLLKLLPGDYPVPFEVTSLVTLNVVATGARLIGNSWVKISAGTVDIRGLAIAPTQTAEEALSVGSTSGPRPTLSLHDVNVTGPTKVFSGTLKVETSSFTLHSDVLIDVSGDISGGTTIATFYADRVRFESGSPSYQTGRINTLGRNIDLRVTNSLLINTTVGLATSETGNKFNMAFNTVVFNATDGSSGIFCGPNGYAQAGILENNVIVNSPGANAVSGIKCTLSHNVLLPQTPALAGNVTADPQFVDATTGDFHLKTTSPARDAAVPSAMLTVDHDYDGTVRPQGSAPDVGAFEYH